MPQKRMTAVKLLYCYWEKLLDICCLLYNENTFFNVRSLSIFCVMAAMG